MNQPASYESEAFSDISATDFKKHFGKTLDDALRGKAVRITRHGRAEDRWVLLREDDLVRLRSATKSPLDDLREQFNELVARMQAPQSRKAVAGVGTASMAALGKAAVKKSKRDE